MIPERKGKEWRFSNVSKIPQFLIFIRQELYKVIFQHNDNFNIVFNLKRHNMCISWMQIPQFYKSLQSDKSSNSSTQINWTGTCLFKAATCTGDAKSGKKLHVYFQDFFLRFFRSFSYRAANAKVATPAMGTHILRKLHRLGVQENNRTRICGFKIS